MSGVTDFLFGGTDTSAQQGTQKLQSEQFALFDQLAQQARGDVVPLIGQGQADAQLGVQSAIDALQGGQPQFKNAILGLPSELPQVSLPQFGGSAAVFPSQQVGFEPPPSAVSQGLTLAQAQRQVFANPIGSSARREGDARVRELLAAGGQGPLFDALTNLLGAEKGTRTRKTSRSNVRSILNQGSLAGSPSGLFSGAGAPSFFTQFEGNPGGSPTDVDTQDISTMSNAALSQGISINQGISFAGIPGISTIAGLTAKAMQAQLDNNIAAQQVDPGNPQGAPGFGGTGSGTGAGVGMGAGFGGIGVDFGGV